MSQLHDLEKNYLIEQLKAVAIFTEHKKVKEIMDKAIEYVKKH